MHCAYSGAEKDALIVERFEALKGEMCFIVGASGSGKSTLLESVGLMTNTLENKPQRFQLELPNGFLDLGDFWNQKDDERSRIRQEHFSFIFQSANLFPHLTAGCNLELPALGTASGGENPRIGQLVDLILDGETMDKLSTDYSGGQRQRIAFVRALAAPHSILLADEPTGNLDAKRAHKAMRLLQEQTREAGKSTIVVTHDIDLALEFADQFIIIQKDFSDDSPGRLSPNQSWRKSGKFWSNGDKNLDDAAIKQLALASMDLNLDRKPMSSTQDPSTAHDNSSVFRQLFRSEGISLAGGKRPKRLLSLFSIFFLTLFAIGTNEGLIRYLKGRMDSPYLRLLAIPSYTNVPTLADASIDPLKYGVESRFPLFSSYINLAYNGKPLTSPQKVIASSSPNFIIECILDAKTSTQLIASESFQADASNRSAVIITQKLAKNLGYDAETNFPFIEVFHSGLEPEQGDRGILLPVAGIVNLLPEDAQMHVSQDILAWLRDGSTAPRDHLANPNYIDYYPRHFVAESDKVTMEEMKEFGFNSIESPTHINGKIFEVGVRPRPGLEVVHLFPSEALTTLPPSGESPQLAEYLVFPKTSGHGISSIDSFASAVRAFNNTLDPSKSGIELDLNSLETRKNLDIIERLSLIMTIALSILAVFFVMSQTTNMLMMHLERNKRNLGTLKAFGTSNHIIFRVYGGISLIILSCTFLVAWLMNQFLGTPILGFVAELTGLDTSSGELKFRQWNFLILFLIFVGLPLARVILAIRNNLSNASPGDLIYDRNHE